MNDTQQDLRKRLLHILHLGFTEARNLALAQGHQQIADLADAMEMLPRLVDECNEDEKELIRFVLKTYEEKYPKSPYNYLARFESWDPPDRY
jgi:hypothetical protein